MHAPLDFEHFQNTVIAAASGGVVDEAIDVIRREAHAMAGEHGTRFRDLIVGLPVDVWHDDPEVSAALGESYRANGSPRGQSALAYFRAAEDTIESRDGVPAHCVASVLLGHTAALRTLGQMAAALEKSAAAQHIIHTQLSASVKVRVQLSARWSLEHGMILLHIGEFAAARSHLEYAHGLADMHLTRAEHVECLGTIALLDGIDGELERGSSHVAWARQLAEGTDILKSGYGAPALTAELVIANERYDLARSAELEPEMIAASRRTEWESGAYVFSAQLRSLQGQLPEALDQIERAQRGFATWDRVAYGHDLSQLLRAAQFLGLGRTEESWAILEGLPAHENHALCPARMVAYLRLNHGDLLGAEEAIRDCVELGGTHVTRTGVDVLLLQAAIQSARGNDLASDVSADRAFVALARSGARTPLHRIHASTLATLCQRAVLRPQSGEVARMLHATLRCDLVSSSREVEPLSARERLVLAQVQRGLTVAAIASELFISPNTVKTHLRRLYRKLGVGTREEAIRAARSLGLDREITRSSPASYRDSPEAPVL